MENAKTTVPTQTAAPESQLHFLDYWRIIRIRKTIILAVFLLVLLTTTAVTFVLPESYMSTAKIAIEKEATDIEPLGRSQSSLQYDPYFVNTEFEKIQSKSVLYPVITNLNLTKIYADPDHYGDKSQGSNAPPYDLQETYKILRRNLDVRLSRNTSLIEIRAYDRKREIAAAIANAVAEHYKEWRLSDKTENSKRGIQVLTNKLEDINEEVKKAQARVDELRSKYNIADSAAETPVYQVSLEREKVSALAVELTRAEAEYVFYKTKLDELARLSRLDLRKAVLTAMPTEQQLPQLLSELALAEQTLAQRRVDYSSEHPDVKRAAALLEQVNKQIEDRLDGILSGLTNQVVSLKARRDQLQRAVEEAKRQVTEEAQKSGEYFLAKRELENKQKIRDAILLRTLQEEVDMALPKLSMVQVVEAAEPAKRPVRPNIVLNIVLGAIVGLVMGVGLAFFIEYLDTSVKTIDDVERALQSPVLGVIPQNIGNILKEGPDSPHAEAYRVLRTNILFSRKNPSANALTAVSGGAGEGKSTTIFNLAAVFAQNGQRVLIVDSDLRRPSLHKFLGVSNSIGLTNYLLKQNTLEEVIQTTSHPNLDFLPSGKLPSSALGILNSARMKEFIDDVKRRYDFVFFDSPPIMGVSDASIIASLVDLSILVVQYRKYPQAMTLRAKQMVEKVGGTMLGVVLNNINISQDSYYYYYSGYYYDYYSKYDYDEYKHHDESDAEKQASEKAASADLKPKY